MEVPITYFEAAEFGDTQYTLAEADAKRNEAKEAYRRVLDSTIDSHSLEDVRLRFEKVKEWARAEQAYARALNRN